MPNGSWRFLPFVLAGCCHATLWAADIQVPADHASIQQAINVAVDGDTVLIAPGTYNENIDFLGKAITVKSTGGAAVTIIDATGFNASVVKFITGEGSKSVLSDLTITGGTGTMGEFEYSVGGGIYVVNSSPSILNCIITANTSEMGGGIECKGGSLHLVGCTVSSNKAGFGGGGGIHVYSASPLVLDACTFEGNCGNYSGGGVYAQAQAIVNDCTFTNNTAHHDECPNPNDESLISGAPSGGGIYVEGGAATIVNTSFVGNTAYWAGGGYGSSGAGTFTNCLFENNQSELVGGGIGTMFFGNINLNDCTLIGNSAGSGGGMYISGPITGMLHATNCTFAGNIANDEQFGNGGAVAYNTINNTAFTNCAFHANTASSGGAISSGGSSSTTTNQPHYLNCVFTDNTATATTGYTGYHGGGAVHIQYGVKPRFTNCLFTGNSAASGYGGAFLVGAEDLGVTTSPSIVNCTFSENSSPNGAVIFAGNSALPTVANSILWSNGTVPIANAPTSTTTVTFSNVQFGYPGENNIDADPLFTSASDFILQHGSPCIDGGNNAALPANVLTDLAGNSRIRNGIVDMGAYESGHCAADVAPKSGGDDEVGVDDLILIINVWGQCTPPCLGDVAPPGGNGIVDVDDLLLVINSWGPCR